LLLNWSPGRRTSRGGNDDEKAGTPQGQQAQSVLLAVAGTCGNY
jgi:hypothetical protein